MKFLMFDTETTNYLECPLCYDFGFSVIDEEGNIYKRGSYVIADVFLDKELMKIAFYAEKIPQYQREIKEGKRILCKWKTLKAIIKETIEEYEIEYVVAHNARFDYTSTAVTQRYLTCSKWRYFFPYGIRFVDTLKLARTTFANDEEYIAFCKENNDLTKHKRPKLTAEVLYRYLTNDPTFVESHTGLEDVDIETAIFLECLRRNPAEKGLLW